MTIVEQNDQDLQWAKPLTGSMLETEFIGPDLQVTGFVPTYEAQDSPCDLIHEYENFPKGLSKGQKASTESPEIHFANANTDEELINFVRRFGPVVAKYVEDTRINPERQSHERDPGRLIAYQDMQELRNDQAIYRAALSLVMQMKPQSYEYASAQELIKIIAAGIRDWPRQWERERSEREKLLRGSAPNWKLHTESLDRIQALSSSPPNRILPAELDGRIVICQLVNCFRSTVFPNPLEMHSSIEFGIRPLLYAILRRQFLYRRGFSICLNTECRNFFNFERAGQQFCTSECSLHHRQRVYWQKRGKKLRKKRVLKQKKERKESQRRRS